jgi:hypothetical protein
MPSRRKVQNTHISDQIHQLHGAVLDIVGAMNRPRRDEVLIKEAGISLDRALFRCSSVSSGSDRSAWWT